METTYTIPKYTGNDEVVTLAEAKLQLRVEHDHEDAVIQSFIDAAVAEAEKQYLQDLMAYTQGKMKESIRISGLSQSRLYSLMKKYRISRS